MKWRNVLLRPKRSNSTLSPSNRTRYVKANLEIGKFWVGFQIMKSTFEAILLDRSNAWDKTLLDPARRIQAEWITVPFHQLRSRLSALPGTYVDAIIKQTTVHRSCLVSRHHVVREDRQTEGITVFHAQHQNRSDKSKIYIVVANNKYRNFENFKIKFTIKTMQWLGLLGSEKNCTKQFGRGQKRSSSSFWIPLYLSTHVFLTVF